MWVPDYDFELFEVPYFSALEANEFGAATRFQANDPSSFVDYSLNQLYGLLDPRAAYPYVQRQFGSVVENVPFVNFFQGGQSRAEIEAEVAQRAAEFEKAKAEVKKPVACPEGYSPVSVFGLFSYCGKDLKSDDSSVGTTTPTGGRIGEATKEWLKSLPAGSGTFLIAVVVIVLLFLFVRR